VGETFDHWTELEVRGRGREPGPGLAQNGSTIVESLLASLGLVFLAELGDKTQLVAMGFGARHRLAPVLTGVALAYAATNLVSVVLGGLIGAALPTRAIGIGGGVLFLAFAAWGLRDVGEEDDDELGGKPGRHIVWSVAAAMFVAELGDKTMLATATLAAQGHPVLVWIGATIGIILSGGLGVLVGRFVGSRIPDRVTRIGSSAMFALFGVVLIVTNL
jgi:putative Ca2+/H+ antiporter (TMEM165/GDT1 family)